jgi:hypothetical protein
MKKLKQIEFHKINITKIYVCFGTTSTEDPFVFQGSGKDILKYLEKEFQMLITPVSKKTWQELSNQNGEGENYYQVYEINSINQKN